MADQNDVIAFLADGSSYGRRGTPVEHVETHISHVFLVGDRVYKLKKALQLPYLDYSTLALRENYCRKELALNRRTAPDLYLGVHAITRHAANGLAFDGAGPAIDWVLEMRRFPAEWLFEDLAERGRLTSSLIRDLIDSVVAFHNAAEIVTDRGGSGAMRAVIEGNQDNLLRLSPRLDHNAILRVSSRSIVQWSAVAELLDTRQRQGKVRRCHGDLHLGNICLFEGRPTLFDCIEFNDELACIDVSYDLAFLLMDLAHRGLDDLTSLAFNRYLDITGDTDALPALNLFMSMRAAIRAHVTLTKQGAGDDSPAIVEAQSYLALAEALLGAPSPIVIAVGGLSGTGKSTLARALASNLRSPPGLRHIRSDAARKRLSGLLPETRLPPGAYTQQSSARVYAEVYREVTAALASGHGVIADATFLKSAERDAIAAIARSANVPFLGLWLEAPRPVMEARLDVRRDDASDAGRQVLDWQLTLDLGPMNWHRLDACSDIAELCVQVRSLLEST